MLFIIKRRKRILPSQVNSNTLLVKYIYSLTVKYQKYQANFFLSKESKLERSVYKIKSYDYMEYLNNFRKLKKLKFGINIKKHIILCRQSLKSLK